MSIYCIDIDGVICTNTNGDYHKARPIRENIASVNCLFNAGHHILLWTARGATTGIDWWAMTTAQLHNWGVQYHELRTDKPHYDYIVDDKCTVLPPA